ncbi:TIGR03089 family protein [Virgisporangium aurantiacum]|uniref:Acyl-CoA synthetase n=1 Tax=Virgisporangium aurantiacum TaxID=175570 RepID=A0A8J3Z0I7_9ACTN|nr:TIGR03089 family protein [Virgisporangium aurantiacum]GIJ53031.1 acyl-CoA synthetase [Virgisporangium aurantiacum]
MTTLADLPARTAAADPARPLLTFYDDGTGEWVELSGNTFANWVSKTANLLVDGCGLGPGDTALVAVTPHWQTAAILVGCWAAGVAVETDPDAGADVAFASSAVDTSAGDRFFLGLAAMGMPYRGDLPTGWVDYIAEVRPHGDHFRPVTPVRPDDLALGGETHAAVLARATARAGELGIPANGRVLVDVSRYPDPVDHLLAPWASAASIVLCKDVDATTLQRRAETERAGLTLS